jgi:hypothetical protein
MDKDFQTNAELKKLQLELSGLALQLAEIAKVDLDYSVASIKQVEAILTQIHAQYKSNHDITGIEGMALELAAYIVTVIEKHIGAGKWERDSKEFGKDTFPYHLSNGRIIFPYIWCLKRIHDGDGENVWDKFQALVIAK